MIANTILKSISYSTAEYSECVSVDVGQEIWCVVLSTVMRAHNAIRCTNGFYDKCDRRSIRAILKRLIGPQVLAIFYLLLMFLASRRIKLPKQGRLTRVHHDVINTVRGNTKWRHHIRRCNQSRVSIAYWLLPDLIRNDLHIFVTCL